MTKLPFPPVGTGVGVGVAVGVGVGVGVGAAVFTVKDKLAVPMLPTVSMASTSRLCGPSTRGALVNGEVQGANEPPSIRHWAPAAPSTVNTKLGVFVVKFVSLGGTGTVTTGGPVSTTKEKLADALLPAASVARTSNEYEPSPNAALVNGDVQFANAFVSTRH